jgi:sucrose-6-phosphate hydrolase SacC (GH32 family)
VLPLSPSGQLFRLQAEVNLDDSATLTLSVRGTRIVLSRQSMNCGSKPVSLSAPLTNFDVLIDRTSVEVFANEGAASMSKCFLPTESGISLRANGGQAAIKRMKLIQLKSAWPAL